MQSPSIGRQVVFRSRTGNYAMTATIIATVDTLWPAGVERGDVPALSSSTHVHLHVLSPGAQGAFAEYDVPFDGVVQNPIGRPEEVEMAPCSWAWPGRVGELRGGVHVLGSMGPVAEGHEFPEASA